MKLTPEKISRMRTILKRVLDEDIHKMELDELQLVGVGMVLEQFSAQGPMQDVVDFHRKFGINYEGAPRQLPLGLRQFRMNRLEEEMKEYLKAYQEDDLVSQFDGLIDMIYIALGTIHLQGWDFVEGWRRVHAANMAKERSSAEKPGKYCNPLHDDGKPADIIKPAGWMPPILHDLVKIQEVENA